MTMKDQRKFPFFLHKTNIAFCHESHAQRECKELNTNGSPYTCLPCLFQVSSPYAVYVTHGLEMEPLLCVRISALGKAQPSPRAVAGTVTSLGHLSV